MQRDEKCWVKVCGCERVSSAGPPFTDAVPFARKIVETAPDRVIWGTDWPHPNVKVMPNDGDLVDLDSAVRAGAGAAAEDPGQQSRAAVRVRQLERRRLHSQSNNPEGSFHPMKTGLVVSAHPGDFVWRAGGAIALHAKKGYRVKIVCLSFGERGECQFAWKETGVTLEKVKAGRKDEAERAAAARRRDRVLRCRRLSAAAHRGAHRAADRHLPRAQSELRADACAGRSL